ncbi:MAG: CbiX/SirB N-terminal domain-containing protein [Dermabacter sp.]|nr:CbiX/SirB N-terminal domain-containing protein [Dermabacter sp.]
MTSPTAPALIGIAHGSRNRSSSEATEQLVHAAGKLLQTASHAAYLEDFASPSIPQVAAQLSADGHARAIAVPLLFTSAYHATVDAPGGIREAAEQHAVAVTQSDVLGTGDDMLEVLLTHLATHEDSSLADARGQVVLFAVGSSRPGANEAVTDLAERLAEATGRMACARFATCAPRAKDHLEAATAPGTFLPLFTAPGLLLDSLAARAEAAGWQVLPHLGTSLAPLVAARYRAAL